MFDLFLDQGFSDYAKVDLKAKIKDIDEREHLIDKQTAEINRELEAIQNAESIEKEIEEMRKMYQRKIKNPSFELKKHIVRKWIEQIVIQKDGSVRIRVRIAKGEVPEKGIKEILYMQNQNLVPSIKFEEVMVP